MNALASLMRISMCVIGAALVVMLLLAVSAAMIFERDGV
jgi:hypothetical protein